MNPTDYDSACFHQLSVGNICREALLSSCTSELSKSSVLCNMILFMLESE